MSVFSYYIIAFYFQNATLFYFFYSSIICSLFYCNRYSIAKEMQRLYFHFCSRCNAVLLSKTITLSALKFYIYLTTYLFHYIILISLCYFSTHYIPLVLQTLYYMLYVCGGYVALSVWLHILYYLISCF